MPQSRTGFVISPRLVWLLRPCGFEYSREYQGWVLRRVGKRFGPVFREAPRIAPAGVGAHSATSEPAR